MSYFLSIIENNNSHCITVLSDKTICITGNLYVSLRKEVFSEMEFFGYTMCGPQNYMKDILKEDYREPMSEDEVKELFKRLTRSYSDKDNRRGLNGFAYGSFERFFDMKKKGVLKLLGPCDMYRFPPTSCYEFGWWQYDACLAGEQWYQVIPRHPQPVSPNSLILDKEKKTNKYATLF